MTEETLAILIGIVCWLYWGLRLIDNFENELEELNFGQGVIICLILLFGAGFFFIEEVLEILIDIVAGEE